MENTHWINMNRLIVVGVFFACIVLSQAIYLKPIRPKIKPIKVTGSPGEFCYDWQGKRVRRGKYFYDGCNTCKCVNGKHGICKMTNYCPIIS